MSDSNIELVEGKEREGSSHLPRLVLASVASVVMLLGIGGPVSMSAHAEEGASEVKVSEERETMRLTLRLAHAVTLEDAIRIVAEVREPVLALRFENENVVGEYSPQTGISPAEFTSFFESEYGTRPRITGVVVDHAVENEAGMLNGSVATALGQLFDEYSPPAVKYGGEILDRAKQANDVSQKASQMSMLAVPDWRPDQTNHAVGNSGTISYFGQYFAWQGGGLYSNLPNGIGLEFEINQDNSSVGTPNYVRPACYLPGGAHSRSSVQASPLGEQ